MMTKEQFKFKIPFKEAQKSSRKQKGFNKFCLS